jgi:hypothetical protein
LPSIGVNFIFFDLDYRQSERLNDTPRSSWSEQKYISNQFQIKFTTISLTKKITIILSDKPLSLNFSRHFPSDHSKTGFFPWSFCPTILKQFLALSSTYESATLFSTQDP